MKGTRASKGILSGILLFMGIFFLAGCASMGSKSPQTPAGDALSEQQNAPQYLDFGDVLLPKELSIQQDDSFVFKTNGQTVGLLSLKGRVDMNSLISFFENNMGKDNWRLISYFKSKRTLMLFQKQERWCVISILDQDFYTYAKIWVTPSVGGKPMEMVK
jgi:hypothetical protein